MGRGRAKPTNGAMGCGTADECAGPSASDPVRGGYSRRAVGRTTPGSFSRTARGSRRVEPAAREVPYSHRLMRPGRQDPQGGGEPTRVADRDGVESPFEGQDDAGEAAVSARHDALGRFAGDSAGSGCDGGHNPDSVDRFHGQGRKRVCGWGSGDGGGGLCRGRCLNRGVPRSWNPNCSLNRGRQADRDVGNAQTSERSDSARFVSETTQESGLPQRSQRPGFRGSSSGSRR
jgi:hypothetical protein